MLLITSISHQNGMDTGLVFFVFVHGVFLEQVFQLHVH